jgi:hypothetical protein
MKTLITLIGIAFAVHLHAQKSLPDSIGVFYTNEKIALDGKLQEKAWQEATTVTSFTQRELDYGKPSNFVTKVSIVYDKTALYFGIWCYQPKNSIRAKFMQRDFDYDQDDNFKIAISTFNDRRNGYLFIINPNGARADLLVSGNETANADWNGVWDCKASITNEGWFAEVMIPFSSLQFKTGSLQEWAINFERNIRSKNEQSLWQGWTRDCSINCFVNAGTLRGLKNIGYVKRFELKPYGLGGYERLANEKTSWQTKLGGDLNINLTPTLKLNLTTNTDFAQVEADRIAVNLTRFNLFYPEKREFFLEGYQNFQFNLGGDDEAFYTRKIGLENFNPVPILGGARLFGKIGKNNIGLLNIETGNNEFAKATNNSVIRYKRDIGEQSYIGGIFTSKFSSEVGNSVAGIDGAYSTSHFLKKRNLVIGALFAASFDRNISSSGNTTWRIFADYPNDLIDHFIAVGGVGRNFNPTMGFLSRSNNEHLTWHLRYDPRWFTRYGIKTMLLQPWALEVFRTATTKEVESFTNESIPFGFLTKKGEWMQVGLSQEYERIDQPFPLSGSVNVSPGKYWMYQQGLTAGTYTGRKIWVSVNYKWGGFYSGDIRSGTGSLGINVNKHLNFKTDYTNNYIRLKEGNLSTNELAEYVNYAFNPKLDLAFFVQWNSLEDFLLGNVRLHWIPRSGSDLYVVYNRGYDDLKTLKFANPSNNSGAAKLVWRFVF